MNLQKLMERFSALAREQRDFLDNTVPARAASDPAFDFTKDDAYMQRSAELNTLQTQIAELRRLDEQERAFDNPGRTRGFGGAVPMNAEEEAQMFERFLISGQPERLVRATSHEMAMKKRADLVSNGTTTGGYMVPTIISTQIIQDLNALESVRRAGAEVMPIIGNENIPTFNDASAAFVAEAGTIGQTDPTTGTVNLRPTLLAAMTDYSWQWANRAVGNPTQQLARSFARGIAKAEAAGFLSGTGTDEPQGILAGGTSAATAASTTVVTAAELDTLWYALRPEYQANATWILNNTLAGVIRGLESANGQRVWVDNIANGVGTLYGRPVIIDPGMPAPTAGLKPIVVGDFASGYVIGEETGISTLVDPFTQAASGKTRVYMYKFVDGRVKKTAAIKYITMHA